MAVRALAIAVLCFAATLVLPALVAAWGGVYYEADLRERIPVHAEQAIAAFERQKEELEHALGRATRQLTREVRRGEIGESAAHICKYLEARIGALKKPIVLVPFHMNPQLLLWPASYTSLCWLVFVLAPSRVAFSVRTLGGGALVYFFYNWPLWARNFLLSSQGRTVYAYPNIDVHWPSFVVQEVIILGFCLLLFRVWQLWSSRETLRPRVGDSVLGALHPRKLQDLADAYHHWQISSAALALGFLFFTRFFWSIVTSLGDQRYVLTALFAHVLWGITWLLITLRVVRLWRQWSRERARAILDTSLETGNPRTTALETLKWVTPVGTTNIVSSALVAFASFIYPVAEKLAR